MTWQELFDSIPKENLNSDVVIVIDGKNGTLTTNDITIGDTPGKGYTDCKHYIVTPDERNWDVAEPREIPEVFDSVMVLDPEEGDLWNSPFMGVVTKVNNKIATVRDHDGNRFDVPFSKLEIDFE